MSLFPENEIDVFRLRAYTYFLGQASSALLRRISDDVILRDEDNLLSFAIDELSVEIDAQLSLLEEATISFSKRKERVAKEVQ